MRGHRVPSTVGMAIGPPVASATGPVSGVMAMNEDALRDYYDVVVIGGGQAGLATGYHLAQRGLDFVILDAADRIGGAWRSRWDSLRLFTSGRYNGLPGMPFPGSPLAFPTKDEVADYLVAYATRFGLPVRSGTRVERVASRNGDGDGFVVTANGQRVGAGNVIVASGSYHDPLVPGFADQLDPSILQLHASEYQRPSQLREGPVLVVGASNSGAEIALDIAVEHRTTLVGRNTGEIPVDLDGRLGALLDPLIWFAANHILTIDTPMGGKGRALARFHGIPVERARSKRLRAAGVERRYARVVGVSYGLPLLDDGEVVDVANVIWCTGFRRDYSWIDLPIVGDDGWPKEDRGVVASVPGLYFIGLPFQRAMASSLLGGVGRDAADLVDHLAARLPAISSESRADRDRETVPGVGRA